MPPWPPLKLPMIICPFVAPLTITTVSDKFSVDTVYEKLWVFFQNSATAGFSCGQPFCRWLTKNFLEDPATVFT